MVKKLFLALLFCLLPITAFAADTTYYVDTDVVGGTGDGSSWTNAYDHLADVAALQLNLTTGATDGNCTVYCRGTTADDLPVNLAGWTMDAGGTLTIQGDAHTGIWDTNHYRIEIVSVADNSYCIREAHTLFITLSNLQLNLSGVGNNLYAVNWRGVESNSQVCTIKNCIIVSVNAGISCTEGSSRTPTWNIYNNVVYGISTGNGNGIEAHSNDTTKSLVYNNTVYDYTVGITSNGVAKNNISYNNTTDYSGTFDATSTNNLSKDTTAPDLNTYYDSKTVTFTDAAGGDFSTSDSDVVDMGADLGTGTDIIGTDRDTYTPWDIGAFELIQAAASTSPSFFTIISGD